MSGSPDARAAVEAALASAGLNTRGVLSPQRFDALVPDAWQTRAVLPSARSILVLASGGRAFFEGFRRSPEARSGGTEPLDAYTRRLVETAAAALRRSGDASRASFSFERRGGLHADFVALGRAAGLGAPSRLGLLVHPEFGPWLAIRALLFTERCLPETCERVEFRPCEGCPAPCAVACHGAAVAPAGFDALACGATRRREPACRLRCDARRACVLGPEHAYAAEAEAHHMRASSIPAR